MGRSSPNAAPDSRADDAPDSLEPHVASEPLPSVKTPRKRAIAHAAIAGAIGGLVAGVAALDAAFGTRTANAFGAVIGCALVGFVPGVIGVVYFGSQPYAFMGTAMLALAPFLAAWITSSAIARSDGSTRAGALGASFFATALFATGGVIAVYMIEDDTMLDWFRSGSLPLVGVIAGTILGAFIGAHLAVTLAMARIVRRARA